MGPIWEGGTAGEVTLLAACYRNSLEAARKLGLRSVAFPSISTGAYGYPIAAAARTAVSTVIETIRNHAGMFDEIRFVLFSDADYEVYAGILEAVP